MSSTGGHPGQINWILEESSTGFRSPQRDESVTGMTFTLKVYHYRQLILPEAIDIFLHHEKRYPKNLSRL